MRYYFDVQDGSGITSDVSGVECSSLEDARAEARRALCEIALDRLGLDEYLLIRIFDAQRAEVLEVTLNIMEKSLSH